MTYFDAMVICAILLAVGVCFVRLWCAPLDRAIENERRAYLVLAEEIIGRIERAKRLPGHPLYRRGDA